MTDQIEALKKLMESHFGETNKKIESFHTDIKSELTEHNARIVKLENDFKNVDKSEKIEELTLQIELLKQDKLRNNIRVTGIPPEALTDPDETILRIDKVLQTQLIPSDYLVHTDRNKTSLIISFTSASMKRFVMNQMRKKKSLFAEEIDDSTRSNSQIYINDQLTRKQLTAYN